MQRTLQQSLHRELYLSLQSLRGRPVRPFMRQLQAWEQLDEIRFRRLGNELLKQALQYAHANVPLYSTEPWSHHLAHSDPARLQSWPILERDTVRTRARELHARGMHLGLFHRRSSASTGEPLRVAWTPRAAAWGWAHEYHAMLWHGVAPGVRSLLMWGSGHPLQDWVKNCKIFPTTELHAAMLDQAARFLLLERPSLCMGLPSALSRLVRYVRAKYPHAPQSLVPHVKLGGEQVYRFQRDELQQHFGARAIEFYGCTEAGPIAAECPAGSMHLMTLNVHVEICRHGEPVMPGEFGDIVVTSLHNRAMPLVRCRIGDSGRISREPCPCGRPYPVLEGLVGRAADLFVAADGTTVHGSTLGRGFDSVLAQAPAGSIGQVLFQQIDPLHWKVLIESDTGFDAALAAKLSDYIRACFGEQCRTEVERVSTVPREPSGKFRYYRPDAPAGTRAGGEQRRTAGVAGFAADR